MDKLVTFARSQEIAIADENGVVHQRNAPWTDGHSPKRSCFKCPDAAAIFEFFEMQKRAALQLDMIVCGGHFFGSQESLSKKRYRST
jgi:hypothetical protein